MSGDPGEAVIGIILSPHGTGGAVKVLPCTDFPRRLKTIDEIMVCSRSWRRKFKVEWAKEHGRFWLVKFAGFESRDEAAFLKESRMVIPLEERFSLPAGSYYRDQLIGLLVMTSRKEIIGTISAVQESGGHDQLIVKRSGDKVSPLMIPAVKRIVRQVDLGEGHIIVDLPAGLLDL